MKNHSLPIICLVIMVFALPLNIYSQSVHHSGNDLGFRQKHQIDVFKDKHLIKKESPANKISKGTALGSGFLQTEKIRELWNWFDSTWFWQNTTFSTYNTDDLLSEEFIVEPAYIGTKKEFVYDANGYLVQTLEYNFANVWEIGGRVSYTYNTEYKPTEILTESFDGVSWNFYQRIVFTYNANQAEELFQSWTGSGWENGGRYLYTYDANNNLIQSILQDWHLGNWLNWEQHFYTYDSSNLLLEDFTQNWDGNNWYNFWRTLYTYSGLLNITIVDEAWTSQWTFRRQITKTYNSNNLLIEEYIQTWDGLQYWILYYYDINNNLVERTEQLGIVFELRDRYYYSPANFLVGNNSNLNLVIPFNQPVSNTITISGGDGPNANPVATVGDVEVIIEQVLHPNIGDLIFTLEHLGVVDTLILQAGGNGINFIDTKLKDNAELTLSEGTAPFTGSFKPIKPLAVFSGLDVNGDWTLTVKDVVSGNEGTLEAWGIYIYPSSSSDVKYIENNATDYKISQNYPNPFNPSTTIKFQIPETGFISLKIYDILGNEIATLVNEEKEIGVYSVNFDASQLASGIYLYKLQAGSPSTGSGQGFVETKKMILLK